MQRGKKLDIEVLEGIPRDSELVYAAQNSTGNLVLMFTTKEKTTPIVIPVFYDKGLGGGSH